jgi:hypothetical protein
MTTPEYGYPNSPEDPYGQQYSRQYGLTGSGYPVSLRVEYPERLSRGLIFVKWLLLFPHYIVVWALQIVAGIITFIAWFAILFTGRYPRAMFDFNVGVLRWSTRVQAYFNLMTDAYPPFGFDD